jgi:hypothetical protein
MQYLGLQTFALAMLGLDAWRGMLLPLSVAGALLAYTGNQQWKATFSLFGQPSFPLAWLTLLPFVASILCNLVAYYVIGEPALGSLLAVAPPILIGLGGAIEGLFAETRFNQWIHCFAVAVLNAGLWLELYWLNKVPEL